MSATQSTQRRSNKDVAQAMLIAGGALLALALFGSLTQSWLFDVFDAGRNVLFSIWQFALSIGYSVGGPLIVGAIIVNRLPERPTE